MILKLTLDHDRLSKLHTALDSQDNTYGNNHRPYVKILRVQSKDDPGNNVIPHYNVELEVQEKTDTVPAWRSLTPLQKLARVFEAIGLFPAEKEAD